MKISKSDFRKLLAAYFSIASFIYMGAITFCTVPKANVNNANIILGFLLGTTLAAIIGFYFGATEESDKEPIKDANAE
ncbi:hypothetical protein KAU11_00550 [Candidatus Babeliales bacterium]|nr:hypothetical protein [Candidatus Babeliales bacterium]